MAESRLVLWTDADGLQGLGEAAPAPGITGETLAACDERLRESAADPRVAEAWIRRSQLEPGRGPTPAARAALVAAALDLQGKRQGSPLHRLLNLPEGEMDSSVTITLAPVDDCLRQAAEWDAQGWTVFKVKLGGRDDEAVMRALRDRYPDKRIRVDANEGWTPQEAQSRMDFLARHDVEFVEQPLPRNLVTESAQLAARFDLPIILDEPLQEAADALELVRAEAGDGGNIKLAKCGGPFEARRIVKVLRDAGWKVMMGCMVESGLGLSTAAAFAGVLDYADLDGNVTVLNEPSRGYEIHGGRVRTPAGPGLGVDLRPDADLERLH